MHFRFAHLLRKNFAAWQSVISEHSSKRFATIYSFLSFKASYGTLWFHFFLMRQMQIIEPPKDGLSVPFVVVKFPFWSRSQPQQTQKILEIPYAEWIAKCLFKSFNTVAAFSQSKFFCLYWEKKYKLIQ